MEYYGNGYTTLLCELKNQLSHITELRLFRSLYNIRFVLSIVQTYSTLKSALALNKGSIRLWLHMKVV